MKKPSKEIKALMVLKKAMGDDPRMEKLLDLAKSLETFGIKYSISIGLNPKK